MKTMEATTTMATMTGQTGYGLGCGGRGAIGAGTLTPAPVRATAPGAITTGTSEAARANVRHATVPIGSGDGRQRATGGAGQAATRAQRAPDDGQRVAPATGGRDDTTNGEATGTDQMETATAGANPPGSNRTAPDPKKTGGRRANADLDACLAERDDWIVTGRFPVHMG